MGNHEKRVDEAGPAGRTGRWGQLCGRATGQSLSFKLVLFDPEIPLLGISAVVLAKGRKDICTKVFTA